jgi:hypothetical protein
MLHAYVERFDMMGERGNILGWNEEVNKDASKEGASKEGAGHGSMNSKVLTHPVCYRQGCI